MHDVIVVGSGPSGLSCAIESVKAGLSTVILEKGGLADAIRRFPTNLVWFSTPETLEIGGIPFITPTVRPTRVDTMNYYQRVARHFDLDVRYYDAVTAISRTDGTFQVLTEQDHRFTAPNVIVATGYFDCPNWINASGEHLPKVMHYYDEPYKYFDADVAVVGGSNSAVEAALDLYRHGSRVTLIHRNPGLSDSVKYWVMPDITNRIKAGDIKALFKSTVCEIRPESILVNTPEGVADLHNDFSFILTGFHPDTGHLREYGIQVDSQTLAPVINKQTYETNVPGLYVAGSVVAGKNTNQIFVENGRLHGAVIISSILAARKDR